MLLTHDIAADGSLGGDARLGEYELLAKLGEGGMGAVYKARQVRLDKIVALKVLPKGHASDPQAISRFEREMKAVGRLDHTNIVRAMDARDIDGTTVLVMEYVDGLDLAQVVRRVGPLPIADACELVRQAAVGLQYAHQHGLVHRDIKPSNLMLTRGSAPSSPNRPQDALASSSGGGVVKILDLGLAMLAAERAGKGELTASGEAMGTADYMAPEQAQDSHKVDVRADIYSLGCTLFNFLTGHAPFSGPKYESTMQKMMAHVETPPPPVRRFRDDVPQELEAMIQRMLAKDPAERFQRPGEVAEALAPFCSDAKLAGLFSPDGGSPVLMISHPELVWPEAPGSQPGFAATRF